MEFLHALAQMEGWGWQRVHDPAMLESVTQSWTRSLATGASFEMEFPLRRHDGAFRWFLTRVRPLRGPDGEIERWIGTNTDIDDNRRAQASLQRSIQLRDEFLSVASHELRTPLASLILQLQLSRRANDRGDDRARIGERLEVAERQQQRLSTLVEEMLDVSQISLGKLDLQRADVDLVGVVTAVIGRLEAQAVKSGSTLRLSSASAAVGRWDAARLDQVVTNLVRNAITHGEGKPIELVIAGDAEVSLEVRDQGIGIAPEDLERVFERFERAVSARNYGGLGLGLYLSREIIHAHGGELTVRSVPAGGSTFRVTLPRSPTETTS